MDVLVTQLGLKPSKNTLSISFNKVIHNLKIFIYFFREQKSILISGHEFYILNLNLFYNENNASFAVETPKKTKKFL